jgi:hypothetical protein
MANILALDLGTNCGFCYNIGAVQFQGTWKLATDKELRAAKSVRLNRRADIRVTNFFQILKTSQGFNSFDHIVFEDVRFHTSLAQSQLWSSLRAAVWIAFRPETIEAVDVGTLKKFATGSGAADKSVMKKKLIEIYPYHCFASMDDNAIDATWLWIWARINLSKEKV